MNKKVVKTAIIIIAFIIVGQLSFGMLLPFPYGLGANLAVVGIGIFFICVVWRKMRHISIIKAPCSIASRTKLDLNFDL